jgi:hypothetical protein
VNEAKRVMDAGTAQRFELMAREHEAEYLRQNRLVRSRVPLEMLEELRVQFYRDVWLPLEVGVPEPAPVQVCAPGF